MILPLHVWGRSAGLLFCNKVSGTRRLHHYVTIYKYVHLPCVESFGLRLRDGLNSVNVKGRVLVAREGVNGQLCVPVAAYDSFCSLLSEIPEISDIANRRIFDFEPPELVRQQERAACYSSTGPLFSRGVFDSAHIRPFDGLHVRVRPQIVNDGGQMYSVDSKGLTWDVERSGLCVTAREWHDMMEPTAEAPPRVVVDIRNNYESRIGYFEGALRPDVSTFRQTYDEVEKVLKGYQDHTVMLYCTGGVRCVKVGAHLLQRGFKDVVRLDGGVDAYVRFLHDVPAPAANETAKLSPVAAQHFHGDAANPRRSRFHGRNFVFNSRLRPHLQQRVGEKVGWFDNM